MSAVTLTIIGKLDCHLCEVATEVIDRLVVELAAATPPKQIVVQKRSILDDSALYERYWEQIPVVLINGEEHAHWRVDPTQLREAILNATPSNEG